MANTTHRYSGKIEWTGNRGRGTSGYDAYKRDHTFSVAQKPILMCSSDTAFNGDATKYNPEDMLLYSLSSCHMLWYLHLCADAGIVVTKYTDEPTAKMAEAPVGKFTEAKLNPTVVITDVKKVELALQLHEEAHKKCFIANSVNFEVLCNAKIVAEG